MVKRWILAAVLAAGAIGGGLAYAQMSGAPAVSAQTTVDNQKPQPMSCGTTDTPCKWQDDCCEGYYCGGPSPPTCQPKGH